jgi:RimJ/RimL family protein N-acetyltransferase
VLRAPALYEFTGGSPPAPGELRDRYARQVTGRSPDGTQEWHNWVLRLRPGGAAIGTVQATITGGGRSAEIAWVVGQPWQGHGYATEAARALTAWLDARGVAVITACIHPRHAASAAVAARAGLLPTGEFAGGERVWRRERPPAGPRRSARG